MFKKTSFAFALAALALTCTACSEDSAFEEAGENVDEAVEDTSDALENAADDVEDGLDG